MFRGILFGSLKEKVSPIRAIIISSFFFFIITFS
ncbi:CPBP family glutamic-type intramembrane protease [Streptococcus dysgalactiae]